MPKFRAHITMDIDVDAYAEVVNGTPEEIAMQAAHCNSDAWSDDILAALQDVDPDVVWTVVMTEQIA